MGTVIKQKARFIKKHVRVKDTMEPTQRISKNGVPDVSRSADAVDVPEHEIEIKGYRFKLVCQIIPRSGSDGKIIQKKYEERADVKFNKYGEGSFCKFDIDTEWKGCQGVYAVIVDGDIAHIGKCEDLHRRFSAQYGNISDSDCRVGGQPTNCRVNSKILECAEQHRRILLYFLRSSDACDAIKDRLGRSIKLPWNIYPK